ncbi:MAG: hypothetical protein MJE77_07880, partial [Proteobacteria bacterium]|nr:hypothetical protein [Pseudomonadota bacterium]
MHSRQRWHRHRLHPRRAAAPHRQKVNGALESGFLYQDDLNPVAQLDASGNVIARFVYAEQGHVPAYMTR